MRVLVVIFDRDVTQLETICRGLLVFGHEPSPARDVAEARALVEARDHAPFDVLLTEVAAVAPRELARVEALTAMMTPSLPVVVMTGVAAGWPPTAPRVRLLTKPFTPHELDAAIRAAAASRCSAR